VNNQINLFLRIARKKQRCESQQNEISVHKRIFFEINLIGKYKLCASNYPSKTQLKSFILDPDNRIAITQEKCLLIASIHLLIVPINPLMISDTLGNVQKYEN
jgi:hypothetical protein